MTLWFVVRGPELAVESAAVSVAASRSQSLQHHQPTVTLLLTISSHYTLKLEACIGTEISSIPVDFIHIPTGHHLVSLPSPHIPTELPLNPHPFPQKCVSIPIPSSHVYYTTTDRILAQLFYWYSV